mmetsp:Transcript_46058/g.87878  ORF Transcript_46058/g.87878 Transcript_46058/m.87878 type:complete len:191 (+) Transcript_46058:134-706(+)
MLGPAKIAGARFMAHVQLTSPQCLALRKPAQAISSGARNLARVSYCAATIGAAGLDVKGGRRVSGSMSTKTLQRRTQCNASGESAGSVLEELIKKKNEENMVIVYSKSWCPFCTQVKSLFQKLNVDATVVELDGIVEEQEILDALYGMTGQRTVPNVFVGGQHVGGCDDTMHLNQTGELKKMLEAAGWSA